MANWFLIVFVVYMLIDFYSVLFSSSSLKQSLISATLLNGELRRDRKDRPSGPVFGMPRPRPKGVLDFPLGVGHMGQKGKP